MKDLDSLIENTFSKNKKDAGFNFNSLLEIVSEVLETMPPQQFIVKEKKNDKGKTTQFTISMIPDLEVSELGWSDVRTPEEGQPVKGRERQILEAYLENIVGSSGGIDSLPQKLEALSQMAQNPETFVASETAGKSSTEKLRTVISFLVFYKTLTKIIANFNASSAGFSFESFLATLLKGRQIPASGADTIADFVDEDGVKVSLKLYNESGVEVGGSFVDLVGDLVKDEKMTYLVVMKDLRGSRESLNGVLTFYKFDFTIDNVMEILQHTKPHSASCIILPLDGLDSEEEIPARINAKQVYKEAYEEFLEKELGQDVAQKLLSEKSFQPFTEEFKEITTGGSLFYTPRDRSKFSTTVNIIKGALDIEDEVASQIAVKLREASQVAINKVNELRTQRKDKVGKIVPSMAKYLRSPSGTGPAAKKKIEKFKGSLAKAAKESAKVYSGLSTDEKKRALLKTFGYINERKFSMNKTEVIAVSSAQGDAPIGTLTIGTDSLQKMLDSSIAALNTDIFSIFSNLQDLSDSLNYFFAGGLADDNQAINAIDNANAIEGKTEKIRK